MAAQARRRRRGLLASDSPFYHVSDYKPPLPRTGQCEITHETHISGVADLLALARAGRL
tara:strand:- start:237 stop:413 length:177 start_codon:yes stop_codon:yes gene_type:complete